MGAFDFLDRSSSNVTNYQADDEEESSSYDLPPYLLAADVHNVASTQDGFSFTDPSSWIETASNASKFVQAAAVSGLASIYNSGVAATNFFGGDAAEIDVQKTLLEYDTDIGKYYQENQSGVDLVGFIAGSFIPGGLALKAINVAKTGLVGANVAKATKLLSPDTDILIATAGKELAKSQAVFSALNTNVLSAFGGGLRGAVAESIVAEVAITATMFKSPILEEQDLGDLTSNILWGGALGGAIGGAITAARIYGGVKKTLVGADADTAPVRAIDQFPASFSPSSKLILASHNKDRVVAADIVSDLVTPDTVTKLRTSTLDTLDNDARLYTNQIANKDNELGNMVYDNLRGLKTSDVESSMFGVSSMGRVGSKLKEDKIIAEELAAREKANLSVLTDNPITAPEPTVALKYLKLSGEGKGTLLDSKPTVLTIADTVDSPNAVNAAVKKYGFKPSKEFHSAKSNALETDARFIHFNNIRDSIKSGAKISHDDIPFLETAYVKSLAASKKGEQFAVSIALGKGKGTLELDNAGDLYDYLKQAKQETAAELLKTGKHTVEEIAVITNTKTSYLEGAVGKEVDDLFARQSAAESYTNELIGKGLWKATDGLYPLDYKPTYAKLAYDLKALPTEVDGHVTEAMGVFAEQLKFYEQGVDRAVASIVGNDFNQQMIRLTDRDILMSNRYGSQSNLLSFNNSNYDTIGSKVQQMGAVTARLDAKMKEDTLSIMNPAALKLLSNPNAAVGFSAINQKISQAGIPYVYNLERGALVPRRYQQYLDEVEAGGTNVKEPVFEKGIELEIKIQDDDTLEAVLAHITANGSRVSKEKTLRAAQGLENNLDPDVFYPIRKNYRDYQHFAFVVDDSIVGTGHVSMIHAASASDLENLISKVPAGLRTITDKKSKDYHKALGDYEYSRTLNENYIDSSLKRAGVDSDYFPQTDPKSIVDTWIADQTSRDSVLARETVRAKNEKQFLELERLGEEYTGISASKYATDLDRIEDTINNPYANYIKTALNISTIGEHQLLTGFNNIMDKAFTNVTRALGETLPSVNKAEDLDAINDVLEKYGVKSAYYDAATNLLANHSAPRGDLTKFVRAANTMIATLAIRTDPFNALTNAISSNVLLGAETNYVIKAIKSGSEVGVGRLTQLAKIKLPGTDADILSPKKLIAEANKKFIQGDEGLAAFYKANGWNARTVDQYRMMMEDLTLRGAEDSSALSKRTKDAYDKFRELSDTAEKFSGNKLAEEYNRFVAASVMKQITDIAVEQGIITIDDSYAMINTFVNRTQGNILASQRPLVFQGAVGTALGLFQTYQFNMMQQLFRYVGEGSAKDAAMLVGLQGSIFGMNGLPAFNAINTHIIGNASGNKEHKDLFDATYDVTGKQIGDWLMYGAASNFPKLAGLSGTNLYTRGDLNPRQVTIIPINPADFPAINALSRLYTNIKDTGAQILSGADISESLIQAVEHNGFSRPLAGLAAVSQSLGSGGKVYTTDTKGNIAGTNDMMSFSSLIRLSGGKPMDEAITSDRFFNVKAYAAKDRARMDTLRESVKKSVIQGNTTDDDEIARFSYEYAKAGGKQKNFNKFMMEQYTNANTPASQRLAEQLSNPLSQTMQEVMKGRSIVE